ncbi:MAG: CHAT domain-containing protein, partial [Cyanobacteria bacterium J06627_3]
MPTLTIRERGKTATGFDATLSIDYQAQYEITISDPFDAKQEHELEFYFEEWIKFPFDGRVKADRAAASVRTYGEALFKQVFEDPDAYSSYKNACRQGLSELSIEIQGNSPEFQALHWEALQDPKQPFPFAVEAILTRKRLRQDTTEVDLKPSATINVLMVIARPDEESDVGYRTISRPLIEAIQQAQLRVNVELLRPGTFEALSAHLEKKEGYYHIVHFDTHGGLMNYEQYQAGKKLNRYTYQLSDYSGTKAFLFLEGVQKGQANPIDAQKLADLLTNKGIPICILNACQSAKQLQASEDKAIAVETSLGSQLISAGVQMVVAMGYTVTVSAAALMMAKLYGQLFVQKGIPEAIRLGS